MTEKQALAVTDLALVRTREQSPEQMHSEANHSCPSSPKKDYLESSVPVVHAGSLQIHHLAGPVTTSRASASKCRACEVQQPTGPLLRRYKRPENEWRVAGSSRKRRKIAPQIMALVSAGRRKCPCIKGAAQLESEGPEGKKAVGHEHGRENLKLELLPHLIHGASCPATPALAATGLIRKPNRSGSRKFALCVTNHFESVQCVHLGGWNAAKLMPARSAAPAG